jgi:hypothetical protein
VAESLGLAVALPVALGVGLAVSPGDPRGDAEAGPDVWAGDEPAAGIPPVPQPVTTSSEVDTSPATRSQPREPARPW